MSIGKEFMDYYQQQRLRALLGIDDWADRLNYFYTVIIISVSVTVVTVKTYFLNPLSCHCPTPPQGAKFGAFLTETCFADGTIPFRPNESIPQTDEQWALIGEDRKTNYYYWIPFMLGLQMILFYLPDIMWRTLTYNKLGTNLHTLLQESTKARECTSVSDRHKITQRVADSMHLILFAHRNVDKGLCMDMKRSCSKLFSFCLFSKRLGTWTVASYFFVKMLYIANAIGQLYLMRHFLGFDHLGVEAFGFELAKRLVKLRDDWQYTLYFPRTAYCRVSLSHTGVRKNAYTAVCALPVNLFSEKIYVFLWFWVLFVAICTVISVPMWMLQLCTANRRIASLKRYFRIEKLKDEEENDATLNPRKKSPLSKQDLNQFINEFLRFDGLFILEIISNHVGDMVTGEITRLLWKVWTREYADRHNFSDDAWDREVDPNKYGSEVPLGRATPQSSVLYPDLTLKKRPPSSIKSGQL